MTGRNESLCTIASKAEYIADVARAISTGKQVGIVEQALLDSILRQLNNIADTLDEYHDWEGE